MPSVAVGPWGGDHVSLTVATTESHLEFDCAHGDIPGSVALDTHGAFSVSGTFVREHGGPIQVPPAPPDSHPAVYAGAVAGDKMTLTVQLTDSQTLIGTFTLLRGSPGLVLKCLLPLN